MAIDYIGFDRVLRKSAFLQFANAGAGKSGSVAVEFQFPPKILSDGRKVNWEEKELQGTEPVATFKSSGPRTLSLTWTYIVDGGEWTTQKISDQVKLVRGYAARVKLPGVSGWRNLVVSFKLWRFGNPTNDMSCRITSIDVKHSDVLVAPCSGGKSNFTEAYPLRSDVTIDLRLWTKGGPQETEKLPGLKKDEEVNWY